MDPVLKSIIFIVDDDPITISLIEKHIQRCEICSVEVRTFPSGNLAIRAAEKLREENAEIALCIVDYYMEPINGEATLLGLHELFPNAKKILMTGHVEMTTIASILEKIPLFRYISKPWQGRDFEMTIKEAVRMFNFEKEIILRNKELEIIKQSLEITVEERTKELRSKNNELEESLIYARHIQESFLPEFSELQDCFKTYHLFNSPSNNVSGDFIWSKKYDDELIIALGDSTGHGLAGALITTLATNILDDKMNREDLRKDLSELIRSSIHELRSKLNKTFSNREQFVGLDLAIVKVDLNSKEMQWASLNGNLLIVDSSNNVEILNKSRGFVFSPNLEEKIKSGSANIKDRKVVLMSDGVYDQLSGSTEKRMKLSGLVDYIRQGEIFSFEFCFIENVFQKWKGTAAQTDDVMWLSFEV